MAEGIAEVLLLAGVNPKNLLLSAGAGAALAQVGPPTTDAVVSLIVFVVFGSITIARSCRLLPGRGRQGEGRARLDEGLARRTQCRRDDRAVPRLRRQADRRRTASAGRLSR